MATYEFADAGLRRLTAPAHDAEDLADVLRDPTVAGFDVTVLINEPTHVVGEAIAGFYGECVVHRTEGFDLGAVGRALLAVLIALVACYGAQLRTGARRRSRRVGAA